MYQRAQLDFGARVYRDLQAVIEAQRIDRLRSSIGWLESYHGAVARSFGPGSAIASIAAAMKQQSSMAPLRGLSESLRIAALQHQAAMAPLGGLSESLRIAALQHQAAMAPLGGLSESLRTVAELHESLRHRTFTTPQAFSAAFRMQLGSLTLPKIALPEFRRALGLDNAAFTRAVESAVKLAASRVQATHSAGLAEGTVRELEVALNKPDEVQDVLTEVASAVQQAATKQAKQIPWNYLLSIILAVVFFLLQWQQGEQTSEAIADLHGDVSALATSVRNGVAALSATLGRSAVATHTTWLYSRSKPHASRTAQLPRGAHVFILHRQRKWSFVLVDTGDAMPPSAGWVRQKYLRYSEPD
jgi:hypothetical protein